jgi:UDP-2-acetamido-3-amino-2,3-dideoxy-glucuronate N-acetyltransferase
MVFTNVYNPRAFIPRMSELRTTPVKRRTTLGANCTIVWGYTIGRYAFVAAGAVIIQNIQDYALMAGNPARPIGPGCRCGEKLPETSACTVCAKRYRVLQSGLQIDLTDEDLSGEKFD